MIMRVQPDQQGIRYFMRGQYIEVIITLLKIKLQMKWLACFQFLQRTNQPISSPKDQWLNYLKTCIISLALSTWTLQQGSAFKIIACLILSKTLIFSFTLFNYFILKVLEFMFQWFLLNSYSHNFYLKRLFVSPSGCKRKRVRSLSSGMKKLFFVI